MVHSVEKQDSINNHIKKQDELDQADELRKIFSDVEGHNSNDAISETNESELVHREIDILELPPRNEVHQLNKRIKLKVSRPFLRFVFFSVVIIAIIIGVIFLLDGDWDLFYI